MGWPYRFLSLSKDEVHARREVLDRYAIYAQISTLLPALILAVARLVLKRLKSGANVSERGTYDAVPHSPALKNHRRTLAGSIEHRARVVNWWLEDEVSLFGYSLGARDQWVLGIATVSWLLFLCVLETGVDYLHLTKRFGTVAIAQFPLQYALSLKSFSPFSWLLNSSHEHINRYHQILARAITALLALHAAFYLNFFAQVGVLGKRFFDLDVTVGILAFGALLFMYLTSITAIRKYSYRLFFIVHLGAAFAIPGLILFHARAARPFVIEALVVFLIDLGVRRTRTMAIQASVEAIPGTDLVKITATLPRSRIAPFVNRPGAHVYLTIPRESRPTDAALGGLLYEFLLNPFTVAAVDELASQITLVARAPLKGQITQRLASLASSPHNTSVASIPLNIEGPYGAASRRIDEILGPAMDRILIVAGGVGATFAVPMYRAAVVENPNAKVELTWAVRTAGDATWALTPLAHDGESAPAWANVLDDPNVRIFLTGDIIGDDPVDTSRLHRESSVASTSSDAGDVELNAVHRDRPSSRRGAPRLTSETNRKRPDLRRIVDETFRKSADDRVAVLVCGPHSMTREVRGHVSIWVDRGREVVWHDESFGW